MRHFFIVNPAAGRQNDGRDIQALLDARPQIQGGIYQYTPSHTSASGIRRDAEKMNLAVSQGWKVYHFTPDMVRDGQALTMIEQEVK